MKIESVHYQIDWSKFRRGYSFFVPCIDHKMAKRNIETIAKRLQMTVLTRVEINDGVKGLRVWWL